MSSPVYLYNSANTNAQVFVNGGGPYEIPAAAPPDFAPAAAYEQVPLVSGSGADPGSFYLGANQLIAQFSGSLEPISFAVDLSWSSHAEISSAQFHLFWDGSSTLNWTFLINGLFAGSGSASAPADARP